MPKAGRRERRNKRKDLVEAARATIYENGVRRTTLAMIAERAKVPLGNVYYYFRTKDALIEAVVEARFQEIDETLASLEERHGSPTDQVVAFVAWSSEGAAEKARLGCPIGTLVQELQKEQGPVAERARTLFHVQRDWLAERAGDGGRSFAEALLSALGGATSLAHALGDPRILRERGEELQGWVRARL